MPTVDMGDHTIAEFRKLVSEHLGFGRKGLEPHADAVNPMIKEAAHVANGSPQTAAEAMAATVALDLGMEDVRARMGEALKRPSVECSFTVGASWKPVPRGDWASADVVSWRRGQEHGLLGHDFPRVARDR